MVFTAEDAEHAANLKEKVILVRIETSPEDIHGMHAARGILTARGGMTSHAAVVARGWGKPCIAGCSEIEVDEEKKTLSNGKITLAEGDWVDIEYDLRIASAQSGLSHYELLTGLGARYDRMWA